MNVYRVSALISGSKITFRYLLIVKSYQSESDGSESSNRQNFCPELLGKKQMIKKKKKAGDIRDLVKVTISLGCSRVSTHLANCFYVRLPQSWAMDIYVQNDDPEILQDPWAPRKILQHSLGYIY